MSDKLDTKLIRELLRAAKDYSDASYMHDYAAQLSAAMRVIAAQAEALNYYRTHSGKGPADEALALTSGLDLESFK